MPRKPALAAKRGSAFHAWVERQFAGQLLLGDDVTTSQDDDDALQELIAAFERSPWSGRNPFAVEVPFALTVGAHCIRGRIDAVYRDDDGFVVVDWKTNARDVSDPLQLAIYRRAAAQLYGVPVERVKACFVYVAQGRTAWHDADYDLEALLSVEG